MTHVSGCSWKNVINVVSKALWTFTSWLIYEVIICSIPWQQHITHICNYERNSSQTKINVPSLYAATFFSGTKNMNLWRIFTQLFSTQWQFIVTMTVRLLFWYFSILYIIVVFLIKFEGFCFVLLSFKKTFLSLIYNNFSFSNFSNSIYL